MNKSNEINLVIMYFMNTLQQLTECISKNPEKLIMNQSNYWQDYQNLFKDASSNRGESPYQFKHEDWQKNILFDFIKRSYCLFSTHIENLVNDLSDQQSNYIKNKFHFFAKQMLSAIAPTNFPYMNPDVLETISKTNGVNIVTGFKQFLEDIEKGHGYLNMQITDLNAFKLGENIACTPGKVIYQNDIMQLIHYASTTEKQHKIPLLIVPPWINKYYILDLQQDNSFVKWLLDQKIDVFMISWVNATNQHKNKQFSDYMLEGPLTALNIISELTHKKQINALGYCIGGTLLACLLAYLAKKNDTRIQSATFLTTLLDFCEPGELGAFINEKELHFLDAHMKSKGYLDGRIMAAVFSALRANDLIWSSFVNNYLKGEKPKPFDLLYWNADSPNIPAKVHSFYLKNMYLKNRLVEKNKLKILGVPIHLNQITIPCYFLAAQNDHIVPWTTCYKGAQYIQGKTKFVLTRSGHVAGVVNPPQRNKYGYWANDNIKNISHENFLSHASFTQSSWWNDWIQWQLQYAGKLGVSSHLKQNKYQSIENAPGSYVKIKTEQIENEFL